MTYLIIRFFQNDEHRPEIRKSGLSLEEAKDHCNDPETSSSTCQLPENKALTRERGAWFDGYEEE